MIEWRGVRSREKETCGEAIQCRDDLDCDMERLDHVRKDALDSNKWRDGLNGKNN